MTDEMTKTSPIPIAQKPMAAAMEAIAPTTVASVETGPLGSTPPCSCESGRGNRVARLSAAAEEATQVRALRTRPDVVALRVDQVRAQVDALLWAGIVLGLLFTTANVQQFAAAGAEVFSPGWWVAWLLDPMVSLVLLAVLRAEQVTACYQVTLGAWPRRAKWCAFTATYVMNTWTSWGLNGDALSVSGVVLHSVPPLLVVLSAETGPVLRDRLTEAARRALADHISGHEDPAPDRESDVTEPAANTATATEGAVHEAASPAVHGDASRAIQGQAPQAVGVPIASSGERDVRERSVRERPANVARRGPNPAAGRPQPSRRRGRRRTAPRRLLADYLAEARAALADAEATGQQPDPTPAWCRLATGCSAGTSVKLAAALRRARNQPADNPAAEGRPGTKPAADESTPLTVDQTAVDHDDPEVAA